MTWFNERVIWTKLRLLNAMLTAINSPIPMIPFHCFCSVAAWRLLNGSLNMKGNNIRKLNSMWQLVRSKGKEKP